MNVCLMIARATAHDAAVVTTLLGELLTEIMAATRRPSFRLDPAQTAERCAAMLHHEQYIAFVAWLGKHPLGFIALYECHALYAGGAFGTISELYVRAEYRSHDLGNHLMAHAKAFAGSRGWTRLEVTTPPLPPFERTLAFYEREGFSVTGGRKLAITL